MKIKLTYLFLLWFSFIWGNPTLIVDTLNITSKNSIHRAGKYLYTLEDVKNDFQFKDVVYHNDFTPSVSEIPNFEITKSAYWVKLLVKNSTETTDEFMLELEKIIAEELVFYYKINDSKSDFEKIIIKKGKKKYSNRLYLFDLKIPKNTSATIFIKYKDNWTTTFPINFSSKERMLKEIFNEELLKGIYLGVLFIMVFYNLFIYFSIKDKSYLYYVSYIFFFLLMQLNDLGYGTKYIYYNSTYIYDICIKTLPALTSIFAILFVRYFLKTKLNCPNLDKGLNYLLVAFIASMCSVFYTSDNSFYFLIINLLTLAVALYLLLIGIVLSYKDTFLAKFFLIAWSILLISIIQFNLSNLDIIPYYEITDHSLEIGSLIEVFLLSLALSFRINQLKKEKQISQEQTIKLINEKKVFIENQNDVLEKLVSERTKKLELQNKIISTKNEEKSIMMREIHHRVKNNLQMINSMVRLQTRYHDKDNAVNSLKEVERRILTMALLHEKIYQSDNLVSINIKDYITSIIEDLFKIHKNGHEIKYTIDSPEINLNTESVLYIGLLLNELITNSLKHGFKSQSKGYIHIALQVNNDQDSFTLNVSNNGEQIDIEKFNNSKSLGQRLIKNFVKQLDGTLTIECSEKTTTFSIVFKEVYK